MLERRQAISKFLILNRFCIDIDRPGAKVAFTKLILNILNCLVSMCVCVAIVEFLIKDEEFFA